MNKVLRNSAYIAALFAGQCLAAQTTAAALNLPDAPSTTLSSQSAEKPLTVAGFPKRVLIDEAKIFTSPLALRSSDAKWLVPLTGATIIAFTTDHQVMTQVVPTNTIENNHATSASNALVGGAIAVPVALFGAGIVRHDDKAREAGMLGGEAMTDAYLFGEVVKLITFRERPTADAGRGAFFVRSTGIDSSFPSQHGLIAWSSAAVIAAEYPKLWVQISAYTLAAATSAARVLGQQHFPSDALVGAATGWLIGRAVYRAHHHGARKSSGGYYNP